MKFGKQLQLGIYPPWKDYYIQYSRLKRIIQRKKFLKDKLASKARSRTSSVASTTYNQPATNESDLLETTPLISRGNSNYSSYQSSSTSSALPSSASTTSKYVLPSDDADNDDSVNFFKLIQEELNKVDEFFLGKLAEIRLKVSSIVSGRSNSLLNHHTSSSDANYLQQLRDIYVELSTLRSFCELNHTGFYKILKKYDKIMEENHMEKIMTNIVDQLNFCISEEPLELINTVTSFVSRDKLLEWERFAHEHNSNLYNKNIFPLVRWNSLIFSISIFILSLFLVEKLNLFNHDIAASRCFSLLIFVILLWITEAIPYFATALFIPVLVVLMRVLKKKVVNFNMNRTLTSTSEGYGNGDIYNSLLLFSSNKDLSVPIQDFLNMFHTLNIDYSINNMGVNTKNLNNNLYDFFFSTSLSSLKNNLFSSNSSISSTFSTFFPRNLSSNDYYHYIEVIMSPNEAALFVCDHLFNHTSILLLGGYTLSSAFSRCQLELRVANYLQKKLGKNPKLFILAIMFLGLFLSMWISNHTAPILISSIILPIVKDLSTDSKFSKALLLGLAYACNFGGMMTPISSLQNALAVSCLEQLGIQVSFGRWLLISIPFCILCTLISWILLLIIINPDDVEVIPIIVYSRNVKHQHRTKEDEEEIENANSDNEKDKKISNISRKDKIKNKILKIFKINFLRDMDSRSLTVIVLSILTLLSFSFFNLLFKSYFGDISLISLTFICIMFGSGMLSEVDFNSLSWHTLILVGGGNVLGKAVASSGLLGYLSDGIALLLPTSSPWLAITSILLFSTFIATFVSHTVAALLLLPLVASIGASFGSPEVAVIGTAFAVSGAMGLPFSSFPNVNSLLLVDDFQRPYLSVGDFLFSGMVLTLISVILIATIGYCLIELVLVY